MFSIFSWMRQRHLDLLTVALACSVLASATLAETASVRLGRHFLDVVGRPFHRLGSLTEVLEMLNLGTQLFVRDVYDCRGLTAVPPSKEHGRDGLRDTYTIIQSIKVECWAILQIDPEARIAVAGPADQITPDMIHGIMAYAEKLSAGNEEWAKALTTFLGGVITCKHEERCLLSLPDGNNPPDESVLFKFILAKEDERFSLVTQMVYGRSGFVYGIRWRETLSGGEVIAIFPDIR